jgi:BlaI family penicillinase repressor
MGRPPPPLPTDAELRLLRVLWSRGPSTVREVLDDLPAEPPTGYTTVLKLLQIMHAKGLVIRDEAQRTHVYAAAAQPEATQKQLVADLADRAFGGSALGLVMRALSPGVATAEEIAEIRRLVARLDDGGDGGAR